jgi:hypothetical protein
MFISPLICYSSAVGKDGVEERRIVVHSQFFWNSRDYQRLTVIAIDTGKFINYDVLRKYTS